MEMVGFPSRDDMKNGAGINPVSCEDTVNDI